MKLKAKKIGRVEFVIDLDRKPEHFRFMWKKGKLYISVRGVVLNTDHEWFEIPVEDIASINIDEGGVLTIDFGTGIIKITSKDVNSLRAFRHFLLPYIKRGVTL